jgi:hypothetical protein
MLDELSKMAGNISTSALGGRLGRHWRVLFRSRLRL